MMQIGDVHEALKVHQREREAWLEAMQTRLQHDRRVGAAWLFGSLGRGNADALSDIDLFISIHDADFDALIEQRYDYMAQAAQPLLVLEAPQNWPPGGVYNMALYAGMFGPHQVDWYWVRQSSAQIPSETLVLFDRSDLPHLDRPTHFDYAPVPKRSPEEIVSQTLNMFWVMWLIAAKYLARTPDQEHTELFKWVTIHLQNVASFVATPLSIPVEKPIAQSPAEIVDYLRQLATMMQTLMPQVVAKGGRVPKQIAPYAERYLGLVEAVITAGHRVDL